jgi:hypothetical protein
MPGEAPRLAGHASALRFSLRSVSSTADPIPQQLFGGTSQLKLLKAPFEKHFREVAERSLVASGNLFESSAQLLADSQT